jgi:thiol-disulfide isomerase/thioredoxin
LTLVKIIVDFTATWCGPCKMISPYFAELSEKFTNLIFVKCDVDEVEVSYHYSFAPCLLVFLRLTLIELSTFAVPAWVPIFARMRGC